MLPFASYVGLTAFTFDCLVTEDFMDLISDYQVTMLYYNTKAYSFALVSAALLVGQFAVVWSRVLPYLRMTYGEDSTFYLMFLYFGMPFGCFVFDFLMFLGPFGLLPIVPMPESMKLFVPAYGATRMIAEVLVEALPQWIMQAVIMVLVSSHVRDGTASEVDKTLYHYDNGSFVSLMPKSILISSLTMLKTWYDLVQEAREAGISVAKKGVQLWNVGHGLPLDAIKSGSIYKWTCQYEVSDQELVSLVDALGKNESITKLDLSLAGFEWMPPVKREERSAISTLLEVMNADEKALESLEQLSISTTNKWEIPVGALRSGPEKALKALAETPFLSKGGPEREEMHVMFELLCKNRSVEPGDQELELSYGAVTKVFTESMKKAPVKAKRAAWQASVAQLIVKGMTRRAHFKLVVGTEVLRNVGFGVQELLALEFTPEDLKAGFFEAKELKDAGFTAAQLKTLGYTAKELCAAEIPVSEMKSLSYTARELRDGGYTAQQMRNALSYTLAELKDGRYKAVDLGEAGYLIPDLRAAGFTAMDLRKAMIFTVQMMRDAGYTCVEMKKAGYDAKRIREAGYHAREADGAGYTVLQLFTAGFPAGGLHDCGHTAVILREAGYELMALIGANYNAEELVEAGFTVKEIKEAGTSLVQLKAAGTAMATLKDTGYTVERLKQQGYTANELASQTRGRVDLTHLGPSCAAKEVPWPCGIVEIEGYTVKELRGGGVTAAELRKAKVFFKLEEWKDASWPTNSLREGGYTAVEMRTCGYRAKELHKHGYTVIDLVEGGYPIAELRAIGATAGELRGARVSAKALSDVGYSAKDLLVAGFSAQELIECGFGVAELCEAGFDAIQLRALGFSAKELKAYGYGAGALREAGSNVKELKELGFTDIELEDAGFTRRAVEAVNGMYHSVTELKKLGHYEVDELREYGYIVADLRTIYTVKDIKDGGFSLDELRAGGMPEHAVMAVSGRPTKELRRLRYSAKVLKKIGFLLYELVEGEFTATELKQARYGAEELKEVGFTAGSLKVAGFTSKQLRAARYSLKEMQEGGYFWKDLVIFLRATYAELVNAGFTGLDPKHRLFLEYRETEDGEITSDVGVSILSPRHRQGSQPLGSPRATIEVADNFLKVRHGVALTSKRVGVIMPSTKLRVLDERTWRVDGSHRVLVGAADASEEGEAPQFLPIGWVTALPGYFKSVLGLGEAAGPVADPLFTA
jgi:ribosomal protein L13E